jgi:hypothetical protein
MPSVLQWYLPLGKTCLIFVFFIFKKCILISQGGLVLAFRTGKYLALIRLTSPHLCTLSCSMLSYYWTAYNASCYIIFIYRWDVFQHFSFSNIFSLSCFP